MFDDFLDPPLDTYWATTCLGAGSLEIADSVLRMGFALAQQGQYTDAQIDDYAERKRADFPWTPPLRMEVRSRSSHTSAMPTDTIETTDITHTTVDGTILRGTAGFGFWNYPFSVRGDLLMLPESIWFFYASPPSAMELVPGIPGYGWKAQVVHSMRPAALASLLPTALTMGWARLTGQTQVAAPWLQRLSGTQEALLPVDMTTWHTYVIEWHDTEALFWVDDTQVLRVPNPPTRPLGFVAWLDNQYAIATPRGVLRFGTVASGPQWLDVDSIRIERLHEK